MSKSMVRISKHVDFSNCPRCVVTFEEWLQSRLTAHGFPCGPIDGKIGSKTIAALKAFERSRGFPANGTADEKVVAALKTSSSRIAPNVANSIPDRDIDPADERHKVTTFPRQANAAAYYGKVGTQQVRMELPYPMVLAWDKRRTLRAMTLHRLVAPSAARVFEKIATIYNERERRDLGLDLFGGSLNVRRMRGGSRYSMHSWGIAIDFDPERNGLRTKRPKARLSHDDAVPFWQAWEAEGWLSLGRARNFDWMHVQAARL